MKALTLAAVGVVTLIAAQVTGWSILDRLVYALVGLGLVAAAWSLVSLRGLRLARKPTMVRGQVGQMLTERLDLVNGSRLPKLWVEVDDCSTLPGHRAGRVVSLTSRGRAAWSVSTPLSQRGRYQLGPARLRAGDPFGLFPADHALAEAVEVLVYPTIVPLPNLALPGGELAGDRRTHQRTPHVSPTAGGLRDYVPGDSLNRIAWAHTARLGRLIAKEFEHDPTADVWVVLDMEWSTQYAVDDGRTAEPPAEPWRRSTAEFSIVVAGSLGAQLLAEKRAVGLLAAGQHHEVIAPDRGPRQLTKLLEALSVIQPNGSHNLGELLMAEANRFRRTSTLVVVTPTTDDAWTPALAALVHGGVRASVVLVDAGTFGGPESPLVLVGQLAALRVASHVLHRDDDLASALRQADPGVSARWWRQEGP